MHKYLTTLFLLHLIIGYSNAQTPSARFYRLNANVKPAFTNKSEGEIKIEESKIFHSLTLIGEDAEKYKIQSYQATLYCRGMDPPDYYCRGEDSCFDISRYSLSGCKIYFENIIVSDVKDQYFYLNSFSLNIIK